MNTPERIYALSTSSQIENPDRNDRIRLATHRGLDQSVPVRTFVIVHVSERETRSWQIVSPVIDQL